MTRKKKEKPEHNFFDGLCAISFILNDEQILFSTLKLCSGAYHTS